ncbi:CDP-alcohol phosphatidyltransferase family protein [Verrucomicrobiota bacterium sgz303538]
MKDLSDSASLTSPGTFAQRARAYAVHAYTASGVALAFIAAMEICSETPNARRMFLLLLGTVLIDATDGPLARRWEVKRWAPAIDGRTIDDIVDYLTYTFLPLLLMWRMEWLPQPAALWIVPALMASLFGFANREAKDESGGFFLGFPSYWNIVALYAGLWHDWMNGWGNAALVLLLAVLTVLPVRFIYPNLAPRPWKLPLMIGAGVWMVLLLALLSDYPRSPAWLMYLSLVYPAFYTVLSLCLGRQGVRNAGAYPEA